MGAVLRGVIMKKTLTILAVVLGFVVFLIGISLLMSAGYLAHNLCDRQQFDYQKLYEFVRDETAQGIQTAGKLCAILGGASALIGLFKCKKDNKQ